VDLVKLNSNDVSTDGVVVSKIPPKEKDEIGSEYFYRIHNHGGSFTGKKPAKAGGGRKNIQRHVSQNSFTTFPVKNVPQVVKQSKVGSKKLNSTTIAGFGAGNDNQNYQNQTANMNTTDQISAPMTQNNFSRNLTQEPLILPQNPNNLDQKIISNMYD